MKYLFSGLMLCISSWLCAQSISTIKVESLGTNYTEIQLVNSLESANLCGLRYLNKPSILIFDDGSKVILDSRSEVVSKGKSFDMSCTVTDNMNIPNSTFRIHSDGRLIREYNIENRK